MAAPFWPARPTECDNGLDCTVRPDIVERKERVSPARQGLGRREVGAAYPNIGTVGEDRVPDPEAIVPKSGDEVSPDDRRPVNSDELGRVQPALEVAERLVEQKTARADL
jgi:hypothetical protein